MDERDKGGAPKPGPDWFDDEPGAGIEGDGAGGDKAGAPGGRRRAPLFPAPTEELPTRPDDLPPGEHGSGRHFGFAREVIIYSPAEPPKTGRGFRIPVKTLVFMGAAAVGFYLIWPQLLGFWDAVPGLRTIEWWWFALMVALEASSYACYWGMMKVTLRERRWFVVAMTQMSANAFARVVPGGAASGGSIGYQMLVVAGVPKGRVVTGLTTNTLLSNAVLFMLPLFSLPAILGGAPIDPSLLRTLILGVVLFVLIIVGGRDRAVHRPGAGVGGPSGRPRPRPREEVRRAAHAGCRRGCSRSATSSRSRSATAGGRRCPARRATGCSTSPRCWRRSRRSAPSRARRSCCSATWSR